MNLAPTPMRGGRLDHEAEAFVSALDRRGGGADDNEAQAGQLVSFYPTGGAMSGFASDDGMSKTLKVGSGEGIPSQPAIQSDQTGVRRLTPVECERLQGWPDGWTLPEGPSLADAPTWLDDGFVPDESCPPPDGPRTAACGDGVTAPVAEWIGRRLLALDPEGP